MKISAMKASGITKCSNKKWSGGFSGDPSTSGPSASRSPRPVIQVNEEIHFLVDSNGIDNFPTLVPNEKSIELSRRTYSKKNPIAPRPPFAIHSLPTPARSKSSSTPVKGSDLDGNLQRKRKSRNDLPNPIPTKLPRKNFQSKYRNGNGPSTPQSCPQAKAAPRSGSGRNRSSDPTGRPVQSSDSDSDVEIVAVKLFQPVTVQVSKASSSSSSLKKTASQNGKRKSKFFSPQVNHSEILMNEADVAPTDLFSDGRGSGNSLRWLSANGTIAVPPGEQPPYGFGLAPKNVVQQQPLHLPELKQQEKGQQQESKSKKSRELTNLYKNLDEISWTHEKSFKNLLRNPDYIRHSERGSEKKKNLRKKNLKATTKKVAAANAVARKKSKMARLNQAKPTSPNKTRMVKGVVQTSNGEKKTSPLLVNHSIKKKNGLSKDKPLKLKKEKVDDDDNDVFYMLNPDLLKAKPSSASAKGKPTAASVTAKAKPLKTTKLDKPSKGKQPDCATPKIKTESSKTKSVLKLKPDGPSKSSKSDLFVNKLNPDIKKLKSYVPIKESPPSTSGLQKMGCGSGNSSKNVPGSSHTRPYGGKNTEGLMKEYGNSGGIRHFPNDVPMLRGYLDKNEDMYSAFQNASKLRVRLQPLEHTDLWTTEFYEDFRKHFLDQALRKALENRDTDSSNIMYQELLDSFMSSQGGGGSGASSRVLKRKQRCGASGGAGEEEGVRSSVRQSEGAFRYKEIVVKKHPNYMQVVLVPNEGKQNSLTVEALKELKEAFLLAKKDPNCRAVLLNSSGPYFCTGIDLAPLVGSNKRQAAEDISNSVRDLVMTLGMFTKPVIAAVNGAALGFGVSLLTYCDVVLASDKATFCLPATKIGYIPEGGITYTLPQVVGCSVASEMFMQGRRITAEQACRYGLVSEVIWPTRLMNEVIPRLQTIISQPLQAMEATKTMVRCHLWDKLKGHVDRERRLLCEHWLGAPCQSNIKTLLQTGWLLD